MKGLCSKCGEDDDLIDSTNLCQNCYGKAESILEDMDDEEYEKFCEGIKTIA